MVQLVRRSRGLLAVAALLGAVGLWLSAAGGTRADTAVQTQGVAAAVFAWGTGGGCTQAMPSADFGTLAAGASNTLTRFHGMRDEQQVVGGRDPYVDAADEHRRQHDDPGQRDADRGDDGTRRIHERVRVCDAVCARREFDYRHLGETAVPRAQHAFSYSLTLNVPAAATGGTYTNGASTFTASN